MSASISRSLPARGGSPLLIPAQLLLYAASSPAAVFAGAILWGVHYGLTQGVLAALVADAAPKALRGTAFGVFHLVSGLAILIGSTAAGIVWDAQGPPMTFLYAAIVGGVGLLGLLLVHRRR